MMSYMLMTSEFGTLIRMITLMFSCCSLAGCPGHISDGIIRDINSTCAEFGPKCLHLLEIQCLIVSDMTSDLYGKRKCRSSRH